MSSIDQCVEANISTYEERTYTATELAEAYGVSDAAVRNGWYKWLQKVAPAELLKEGKQFTALAKALFDEFSAVDQKERHAWVADAKQRYSHEWGSAGVIDCEVMPVEVGGTLALMESTNLSLRQTNVAALDQVLQFIDEVNAAEANLSEKQIQQYTANGQAAAIARFRIETQAEQQIYNMLQQRRMGGGEQA